MVVSDQESCDAPQPSKPKRQKVLDELTPSDGACDGEYEGPEKKVDGEDEAAKGESEEFNGEDQEPGVARDGKHEGPEEESYGEYEETEDTEEQEAEEEQEFAKQDNEEHAKKDGSARSMQVQPLLKGQLEVLALARRNLQPHNPMLIRMRRLRLMLIRIRRVLPRHHMMMEMYHPLHANPHSKHCFLGDGDVGNIKQ